MDKSKEQIQEYFNIFDKDGNGTIEKEEIKDLAANVGLNWSDHKLNTVISALDTNGDGKISFEEFYEYFLYGEQKQMDKLMRLKFKHIRNVRKLGKQISQTFEHIFDKVNTEGKQKAEFTLNVGQVQQVKSTVNFILRVGQENQNYSQSVLKNFPYVGDQVVSIILGFKCQNSDTVQEKFQTFFENIIELVLGMIPDEAAQQVNVFKDDLKIEYKALPEELLIRLYVNNIFTESVLSSYRLISSLFLKDNSSLLLNLSLQFFSGLKELGAEPNENLFNQITRGFQAHFLGECTTDIEEYLREGHYKAFGDVFQKNLNSKIKLLEQLTPLALLKNVRLSLNFDNFQKFTEEMQIPELETANVNFGIEQLKETGIKEMISDMPFVQELVDALRIEGTGGISLAAISQEASIQFSANGEGAASLWEKLL